MPVFTELSNVDEAVAIVYKNQSKRIALYNKLKLAIPSDVECRVTLCNLYTFDTCACATILLTNPQDTKRVIHALELINFKAVEKCSSDIPGKLTVRMATPEPEYIDRFEVSIVGAELAGCSLIEEDVLIPEHTEKRYSLHCDEGATEA